MLQNASSGNRRPQSSSNDIPLVRGVNAANQIIQSGRDLRRDKQMHRPHEFGGRDNESPTVGFGSALGQNGIGVDENGYYGFTPQDNQTFQAGEPIGASDNSFGNNPLFMSGLDLVSGNPAGTSLNSVLGGLFNGGAGEGIGIGEGLSSGNFDWLQDLFSNGSFGNFSNPTSGNAQTGGGDVVNSAEPKQSLYQQIVNALPTAKFLGKDYELDKWLADDVASGVKDPIIAMQRYQMLAQPFVEQARENKIRESFRIASDPRYDDATRTEALTNLAYELKNDDIVNDREFKRKKQQWAEDQQNMAQAKFNRWKELLPYEDEMNNIKLESAKESINNARESKNMKLNAQKLQTLFGDGKIYNMPLNETMEDTGLKKTNPEVVNGLNLLNTYARKFFNTDLSANGGWRSEEHQRRLYKEQGKEPFMGSLHLKGQAADVDVSNLSKAQRDELINFAEQLGFNTTYHDIGNGLHLHVELGNGRHIADTNSMLARAGIAPSKSKNTPQGSSYDAMGLADAINSTFTGEVPEGGYDKGKIDKIVSSMETIIPVAMREANVTDVRNPIQVADALYNYYQARGDKGWSLNSKDYSELVSRAVQQYYQKNGVTENWQEPIKKYLFNKYDAQAIAEREKIEEARKNNPNASLSAEERALKILHGD